MYERFFGLSRQPFSLNTDPAFFFACHQYASARTMLDYAVLRREGVSLITGEVGCGKSTLVRAFVAGAPEDLVLGVISNPSLLEDSPIHGVAKAFQLETQASQITQLHADLYAFLRTQQQAGRRVMLVVDEAQYLSNRTLDQLRILSNPEADSESALQLALVGQSLLRQNITHPALNQLKQRVSISLHLEPLSAEDTVAYIDHRLRAAGAQRQIFSESALAVVHQGSRGIPRLINTLCDMAMLYGYAEELTDIDDAVIRQVIADRGFGCADSAMLPSNPAQLRSEPLQVVGAPSGARVEPSPDADREIMRHMFGSTAGKS